MARRINTRAIIWNEGKLLAVKHKSKTGEESPYWALPGGGLDPLESLTDGITREIMEETGIEAKIGRIILGQQLRSGREGYDEELELFFHVTNPEDFVTIDLSQTTHGAEELARIEFVDPKTEFILPDFLQTIDIQAYVDGKESLYIANYLDQEAK